MKRKVFLPSVSVCRKLKATSSEEGQGKLALNWKDPVIISEDLRNTAYKLQTLNRDPIPRTWNANNFRKFYE